jgi:hypothetical protein
MEPPQYEAGEYPVHLDLLYFFIWEDNLLWRSSLCARLHLPSFIAFIKYYHDEEIKEGSPVITVSAMEDT